MQKNIKKEMNQNLNPLIQISKLTKAFQKAGKEFTAFKDIDLSIYESETLGLVGESGSGKSTLAKTILRLIEPTAGSIFYKEKNLWSLSHKEMQKFRSKMQIIFQNPYSSLNPRMTVEDIVGEPLEIHHIANGKSRQAHIEQLLMQVGLDNNFLKRYPNELSGGQRQRVSIARAFALNPKFIICDEPLSALDVSTQVEVIKFLKERQSNLGLSYLFISHDLSVIQQISHRTAVMYLGSIVELAETDQLFKNPLHPYTQALIDSVLCPDPKIERKKNRVRLTEEIPSSFNRSKGCPFYNKCVHSMPNCQLSMPPLKEIEDGRLIRCHLY